MCLQLKQREVCLMLGLQVHGVFMLIMIFLKILKNAQLVKPIANYIFRCLFLLLTN